MKDKKYTNKHKDELGLRVPKDYFKTSKAQILDAIEKENIDQTPVFNIKRILPYAVAASLIIFIGLTFFKEKTLSVKTTRNVVETNFDFYEDDSPVNALFISENNINSYVDTFLEEDLLININKEDNINENRILDILFESDSLIDEKLDSFIFDTVI